MSSREELLLSRLSEAPFVLAPMAGITDCAFRTFMSERGTPLVVSELISANGLLHGSQRTLELAAFEECQRPYGVQLFGETPEALAEGAKRMEEFGADFIDINLGCPVKKVVSKGAGSALLKDLKALAHTLKIVKASLTIPLTIKIRTGWSEEMRNAKEVVKIAKEEGITWVAIHGRTRSAGYSGQADWEYMQEVAASTDLPVIGNGDITSPELAVSRLKGSSFSGVMIGRGCLKNPWIFLEALALMRGERYEAPRDYVALFKRLKQLYTQHAGERVAHLQLKKFGSWFSAGLPESSAFRKDLFQAKTVEDVMERAVTYFLKYQNVLPDDTSHEPFLMGGHG